MKIGSTFEQMKRLNLCWTSLFIISDEFRGMIVIDGK